MFLNLRYFAAMPRDDLTHDATHLQRFVRYELSGMISLEQWWGVNDLNLYWGRATNYRPVIWNQAMLEAAVRNINTTGRGYSRIEQRNGPRGPEFRQTAEDRQSHAPRPPNENRTASRCMTHWLRNGSQRDTWIPLARVVGMLHEQKFPEHIFTEDFVRMNCIYWSDGRLEMRTDEVSKTIYLRATRREERNRGAGRSSRYAAPSVTYALPDVAGSAVPLPEQGQYEAASEADGFVQLHH